MTALCTDEFGRGGLFRVDASPSPEVSLHVSPLTATLSSTNPIENLNGSIRTITRRVKRWRGGKMAMRWVASSLLEAEKKFRRVKGYREMPGLVSSLKALCPALQSEALDTEERVA